MIKGKPTNPTALDGRGRAHILHPTRLDETVCGRKLEQAGKATGKSCGWCAEGAAHANRVLRGEVGWVVEIS